MRPTSCRALFATHFHELTALSGKLARLHNATVRVKEWHGDVVFLHEVVAGAADRSYGIQVAKLAGLPGAVIERAKLVLAQLEVAGPHLAGAHADRRSAAVRRDRAERPPRRAKRTNSPPRSPRSIPTRCRRAMRSKRSTR